MDASQTSGALNVATAAALEAGKLIAQYITQLDRVEVSKKSPNRLVSEIDLRAEQIIIEYLDGSYPEFNIVTEESGDMGRESEFCWVIDPMNGTNNFLHGHPHCCTSIALRHTKSDGTSDIILTAIYDGLRNELFTARRGGGAQLDGRRIRVSETSKLAESLLVTDFAFSEHAESKPWLKSFATVLPRAQSVHRNGSSILDFAYIACGRYDGMWEFGLKEWHTASGSLLVREAGGIVTDISGDTDVFKSGNVIAGNPRVHEKLSHLVIGSLR